ncbi:MAG: hypothetical protein K5918_07910 [Bacteroidales bacterium]|nr:hypothetical protein [Bacteroidales bacterium]
MVRHSSENYGLTVRHSSEYYGLIMRHTPAFVFVHRFAIGTATGRSDSEAVNKNEGRGVSHHQSQSIAPSIPKRRLINL